MCVCAISCNRTHGEFVWLQQIGEKHPNKLSQHISQLGPQLTCRQSFNHKVRVGLGIASPPLGGRSLIQGAGISLIQVALQLFTSILLCLQLHLAAWWRPVEVVTLVKRHWPLAVQRSENIWQGKSWTGSFTQCVPHSSARKDPAIWTSKMS